MLKWPEVGDPRNSEARGHQDPRPIDYYFVEPTFPRFCPDMMLSKYWSPWTYRTFAGVTMVRFFDYPLPQMLRGMEVGRSGRFWSDWEKV
jgi:hypothetical protein